MNHYFENGILTICLEGRIDSNNAAQTEKAHTGVIAV